MSVTSTPPIADDRAARWRAASDPTMMRDLLERHLQPALGPRFRVDSCRIAHVRRRDGRRGAFQYDLRLRPPLDRA